MLTLGACRSDPSLVTASNVKSTSDQFRDQINGAVRRLLPLGNWWTTVFKARVATYGTSVVMPRFVGTVQAIHFDGVSRPIFNEWYQMMPLDRGDYRYFGNTTPVVADGVTPVFQNVPPGMCCKIRVRPVVAADVGKVIRVYGVGSDGNTVYSTVDNAEGSAATLAFPYVEVTPAMRRVTRVHKAVTAGTVIVEQYDPVSGLTLQMARYAPGETDPLYRHYLVPPNCHASYSSPRVLTIIGKEEFVPVVADEDVVQIDNIGAIEMEILSMKKIQAGDLAGAVALEANAVRLLNAQLRDKMPADQTPASVRVFGSAPGITSRL